jgi:DNA-binding response OmpR family regulator
MAKILIVEDDHNLGMMIHDILQMADYEVLLSKEPRETSENIVKHGIQLVLMDKLMSGIDGTDVCKAIRNNLDISETPVLMMSALNDAREVCIEAGATDFIYKPFELNELLSKVKEVLKHTKPHS